MVVGVDEVGRGAWAGPLVVGAVLLGGADIDGLTDSKKLTAKQRQKLAKQIKDQAKAIGLGWVSAETIDRIGLSQALKLAALRAVNEIEVPFSQIIIDGTVKLIDDERVSTQKQADLLVPSVSAASIIAKVARDYYMSEIVHSEYPDYSFNTHVGYGTKQHLQAIQKYGTNDMHRLSFTPVKKALGQEIKQEKSTKVQNTSGRKAEDKSVDFLQEKGFEILDRNWRTKLCEIDIVASKNNTVYFVEVKYRKQSGRGTGIEAVTKAKQKQMSFAARMWQHWHGYEGNCQLSAISLSGTPAKVDTFLETI